MEPGHQTVTAHFGHHARARHAVNAVVGFDDRAVLPTEATDRSPVQDHVVGTERQRIKGSLERSPRGPRDPEQVDGSRRCGTQTHGHRAYLRIDLET